MSHRKPELPVTREVFEDAIVQLAALCPICALAALSPAAALAALSPTLRIYNPAINPAAAMLAFSMTPTAVALSLQARVQNRLWGVILKAQTRRLIR